MARFRLFELHPVGPRFVGIASLDAATLPDDEQTNRQETELCLALFAQMETLCRERDIPFHVIAMCCRRTPTEDDPVVAGLLARGTSVIDARELCGPYFQHNAHPTAAWHEQIAARVVEVIEQP